jgi:hypothetical protein
VTVYEQNQWSADLGQKHASFNALEAMAPELNRLTSSFLGLAGRALVER